MARLVRRIGAKGDRFLVAQRIPDLPDVFIQVWHAEGGEYTLEHRDGSAARHFEVRTDGPEAVIAAMTGWAQHEPGWGDGLDWQPLDLGPQPEPAPPLDVPADDLRQLHDRLRLTLAGGYTTRAEPRRTRRGPPGLRRPPPALPRPGRATGRPALAGARRRADRLDRRDRPGTPHPGLRRPGGGRHHRPGALQLLRFLRRRRDRRRRGTGRPRLRLLPHPGHRLRRRRPRPHPPLRRLRRLPADHHRHRPRGGRRAHRRRPARPLERRPLPRDGDPPPPLAPPPGRVRPVAPAGRRVGHGTRRWRAPGAALTSTGRAAMNSPSA